MLSSEHSGEWGFELSNAKSIRENHASLLNQLLVSNASSLASSKLSQAKTSNNQETGDTSKFNPSLLKAVANWSSRKGSANESSRNTKTESPLASELSRKCTNCRAPGHDRRNCPKPRVDQQGKLLESQRRCGECGSTTHDRRTCPVLGGNASMVHAPLREKNVDASSSLGGGASSSGTPKSDRAALLCSLTRLIQQRRNGANQEAATSSTSSPTVQLNQPPPEAVTIPRLSPDVPLPTSFPYSLNSLTWDAAHHTNKEKLYCYCGGPKTSKPKDPPMISCNSCRQLFHSECVRCLPHPLLMGDDSYYFRCAVCTRQTGASTGAGQEPEVFRRLNRECWASVVVITLCNLILEAAVRALDQGVPAATISDRKVARYFSREHQLSAYIAAHWETLLPGSGPAPTGDNWQAEVSSVLRSSDWFRSRAKNGERMWCLTEEGVPKSRVGLPLLLLEVIRGQAHCASESFGAASGGVGNGTGTGTGAVDTARLRGFAAAAAAAAAATRGGGGGRRLNQRKQGGGGGGGGGLSRKRKDRGEGGDKEKGGGGSRSQHGFGHAAGGGVGGGGGASGSGINVGDYVLVPRSEHPHYLSAGCPVVDTTASNAWWSARVVEVRWDQAGVVALSEHPVSEVVWVPRATLLAFQGQKAGGSNSSSSSTASPPPPPRLSILTSSASASSSSTSGSPTSPSSTAASTAAANDEIRENARMLQAWHRSLFARAPRRDAVSPLRRRAAEAARHQKREQARRGRGRNASNLPYNSPSTSTGSPSQSSPSSHSRSRSPSPSSSPTHRMHRRRSIRSRRRRRHRHSSRGSHSRSCGSQSRSRSRSGSCSRSSSPTTTRKEGVLGGIGVGGAGSLPKLPLSPNSLSPLAALGALAAAVVGGGDGSGSRTEAGSGTGTGPGLNLLGSDQSQGANPPTAAPNPTTTVTVPAVAAGAATEAPATSTVIAPIAGGGNESGSATSEMEGKGAAGAAGRGVAGGGAGDLLVDIPVGSGNNAGGATAATTSLSPSGDLAPPTATPKEATTTTSTAAAAAGAIVLADPTKMEADSMVTAMAAAPVAPLLTLPEGQFVEVQPGVRKYGQEVVGGRVMVFAVSQSVWYSGCVLRYHPLHGRHQLRYDDGLTEWLTLDQEQLRWLLPSV